jgi:hypothetical protein
MNVFNFYLSDVNGLSPATRSVSRSWLGSTSIVIMLKKTSDQKPNLKQAHRMVTLVDYITYA